MDTRRRMYLTSAVTACLLVGGAIGLASSIQARDRQEPAASPPASATPITLITEKTTPQATPPPTPEPTAAPPPSAKPSPTPMSQTSVTVNGKEQNPDNAPTGSVSQDGTDVRWSNQGGTSTLELNSTGSSSVSVHSSTSTSSSYVQTSTTSGN